MLFWTGFNFLLNEQALTQAIFSTTTEILALLLSAVTYTVTSLHARLRFCNLIGREFHPFNSLWDNVEQKWFCFHLFCCCCLLLFLSGSELFMAFSLQLCLESVSSLRRYSVCPSEVQNHSKVSDIFFVDVCQCTFVLVGCYFQMNAIKKRKKKLKF